MPPQFPSIQSFFSSSPSKSSSRPPSTSPAKSTPSHRHATSPTQISSAPTGTFTENGDGFTNEEVDAVLHPPSAQWSPAHDYEEVDIGRLEAGPKFVTFLGRVVNMYDIAKPSKKPLAAKGCLKLMVADDTGAVTVRLWYANIEYKVLLGQLVTVWTVHVSHGEQSSFAPSAAPLFTSIFPERERSCHIFVHQDSDSDGTCKRPYNCKDTEVLPGLMTLKNFANGGYDVDEGKLLVCVKSIGARKKFTTKAGFSSDLISIGVFDDTAEAFLTLTGAACGSASYWQPSNTVLLISFPGWRFDRTTKLSLNANTRIDVDPEMQDALWLRGLAQRLMKREHVNPPFPDVFDTESAETAAVRILYTLADIDEFARANLKERFMGYISVIITDLNIMINYKRNMLMSTECCGVPVYANAVSATCRQCEKRVPLRINPKIIGPVIDETGQIASGKIIFSDAAWTQLLGRTPEQFVADDLETLKYMEHRMLFLRVSLGFGWCLEGSKPLPEEDEVVDLKPFERRQRRLDVLRKKEAKEREEGEKGKGSETEQEVKKAEDIKAADDRLGDVGRLCIWCVKM